MSTSTAPTHRPGPGASVSYNLSGIAVLVLLCAVGAAYLLEAVIRADKPVLPRQDDAQTVSLTLSGKDLTIPKSWFRLEGPVRAEFSSQIDLRIALNSSQSNSPMRVDVTLVPRSRVRPSSALLDGVYLHQFENGTASGVPGLVGKPLKASGGYSDETVWYDPLSPAPFVAKCQSPLVGSQQGQCLRSVYLPSGIAAIYRFDTSLLTSWRDFDDQMNQWLERIGAL
ncbi:hypothetical protein PSQ90_14605 [Devosia rhodophyticola]|uniref:Uncharacterized protein n=1 Tax=Devosia rhodophyticola TaxID=3026423 RepID=A0ABY7YVW8_9HYPH|nr:hypothetical protein [Devosia rhodophyticola]WDR05495.1 hypothetical protein PSQ90_14605 [Devosia rhodophyticola]